MRRIRNGVKYGKFKFSLNYTRKRTSLQKCPQFEDNVGSLVANTFCNRMDFMCNPESLEFHRFRIPFGRRGKVSRNEPFARLACGISATETLRLSRLSRETFY